MLRFNGFEMLNNGELWFFFVLGEAARSFYLLHLVNDDEGLVSLRAAKLSPPPSLPPFLPPSPIALVGLPPPSPFRPRAPGESYKSLLARAAASLPTISLPIRHSGHEMGAAHDDARGGRKRARGPH